MKKMQGALTLATAVTLAVSMTGCSSSSKSSSSSTSGSGTTLPQTAWQTADYSKVKQGGTLTIPISQMPDTFNNNNANGGLGDTNTIQAPLFGGLITNADGSWKPDPNYVESIKVVSNDPQKVEVKLNQKAVWSDGKPVTEQDFESNWKALSGNNKQFQPISTSCWQDIGGVSKGSSNYDYTVTFKNKNSEYAACILPGMPHEVTDTPNTFNTGYAKSQYPSDGPYVVSNIDTSGQVITETPNPKWWGQKPKLDKIIFRVVSQNQIGQAFANGELDAIDTQANPDTLAQAQKRSDAVVQRSGGLTFTHLTFNSTKAPFNDVNVRKGIAQAINRADFAKVVQKGLGVDPVVDNNLVLVPGQQGYTADYDKTVPYDLDAAAADLKKAGYEKKSGTWEKNGQPLSFSITVPSDTATNAQRAQLIQTFMQKFGVKVTVQTVPTAKYFSDYVMKKNFQAVTFSWQGTAFPIGVSESLVYPVTAAQNYTGITDNSLASQYQTALSELTDSNKRNADIQKIDQTIANYVPILPFTPTPTIMVLKKGLVNYGASQFQSVDWTTVGFTG